MPEAKETVLEIDLGNLAHNYRFLRSKLDKDVKFLSVVKAHAYGSDSVAIAKKLQELGTDYFAVAYVEEGIRLRENGITLPILVLHPQVLHFEEIIEHCLEPNLYSERTLKAFISAAEKSNLKDYPVHIKLNTGLNRLGFDQPEIKKVFDLVTGTKSIKIASVFSHLAASEDWQERDFTIGQIDLFRKMTWQLIENLDYEPILHICNTSGVINYPKAAFSMVRTGIGLYGYGNDKNVDPELKPVGTLKTIISQIREIGKGDTVGYNRVFKAEKPTRIATLPIGHADGINRIYGKQKAGVYVNGKYAPIVGNVCMDIIMINVTGIDCEEGDEVIVFGGPQHPVAFAEAGGTISYELITGIQRRVSKKIIPE
ncbi:alanine racemase [Christiangramia gaetbulicola]|uniref:Alanine racemase n=1 Tax=Christiangramia gaetbulicola TaxID=703340 RepID=A0A2T6AMD6_9FLAO|nr:alanine racemase [Christiangramia gaetbulicola]PTX44975.1 alanine racemase [Christiangramia gaetbulicola]